MKEIIVGQKKKTKLDLKKTKRENKKLIDKISATIILQSFLKKL